MPSYICLLRGINVSGQKKIIMTDLKKAFEELGYSDVVSYIQSGNLVFKSNLQNKKNIEQRIHDMLRERFGFDIAVIVLTHHELKVIIQNNPYVSDKNKEEKKLYIGYLKELPIKVNIDHLASYDYSPETYTLDDKVIYYYAANGAGKAKMTTNFFESKLKVKATMRNWRTSTKLVELSK